jgi:hypothetical protein
MARSPTRVKLGASRTEPRHCDTCGRITRHRVGTVHYPELGQTHEIPRCLEHDE